MQPKMQPIRNSQGELLDVAYHGGTRDDVLVILGHGVTGDKDRPLLFWLARALADSGYPCLRMSFSGNGKSEGSFVDSNITKEVGDLTSVMDQLGDGKKIAYIGHSMGGAVGALTAARDERIKVLVSLAGMVHTKNFCNTEFGDVTPGLGVMWEEEEFPFSQSFLDDMNHIDSTLDAARELRVPWLLLHGLADDIVLPSDSRDIKAVLRGPVNHVEVDGADHSFGDHYEIVANETKSWLEKHL